uniref:E3 ubiquitin-protein ligase n=1 Tax=Hucho hucho TaxID=62062 RepID=A0A4W5NCT1_9TELE
MLHASAVVVWEWLNEHGRWRPYSPAVSHHIEAVIRSDPRGGSVVLGQVDNRLSPYILDLQSMHQFRQDTGMIRPVRRSFYDPTSAPGQGWLWEWENDAGSWTQYDTEVGIAIQTARDRQQPWLDLAPLGFCYLVDLQGMTQINRQTQRQRRIQRRSDVAYPLVSGPVPRNGGGGSGPTGALLGVGVSGINGGVVYPSGGLATMQSLAGQPCSCQQCMLVFSVKQSTVRSSTHKLGHRPSKPLSKPPSPKSATLGRGQLRSSPARSTYSKTLPHGLSISRNQSSPRRNAALFARSLSLLSAQTGTLSISNRPPPPSLPPPQPPSSNQGRRPSAPPPSPSGTSPPVPTAALVTPATAVTSPPSPVPSPSPRPMAPQRSAACSAPLPQRSSLAGLSRPALQRIAMAQSRALISVVIQPGIKPGSVVTPLALAMQCCRPLRWIKVPSYLPSSSLLLSSPQDCTICMEALGGPSGYKGGDFIGRLAQCGHQYHLQCLVAMYNNGNKDGSLQCPTCKAIYGVKTGNQPPGKMEYHVIPHSLPGHPNCKTIRVIYNVLPGIQGPEHPNPGKPFTARGFPRHCYLPDSEKGRKVLRLLLTAWDRRLVFSVGTSSTTGESDTVIWNEVHHKTEFGSNLTGHGYPDPSHLDNVLDELKAQGITEEEEQ